MSRTIFSRASLDFKRLTKQNTGSLDRLNGLRHARVPSVRISAEAPVRQGDTFLVRFAARNEGNQTASGLVLRATISQGENEIETSEVTIDYLPTGPTRTGGFFFKQDPQAYSLEMAPVSYLDPSHISCLSGFGTFASQFRYW